MESEECDARPLAPGAGAAGEAPRSVTSESPSWSTIPGENRLPRIIPVRKTTTAPISFCPTSAIKHPIPHLVYTSAYEGND